MRHAYIRGFLALVWIVVAIISGNIPFGLIGLIFLYSAYSIWKKEKDGRGED